MGQLQGKCFLVALVACASWGCDDDTGGFAATLMDDPSDLTTDASDRLFDVEVVESAGVYPLTSLLLTVQEGGGTQTSVNFELETDVNSDGKLGVGDRLVATEPPVDLYNPSVAGTNYEVELFEELGEGRVSSLLSDIWVAQ